MDPDTRPDIFQVSHLSHNLAKKKCDIQNLHVRTLHSIASSIIYLSNSKLIYFFLHQNVKLLTLDDLRSGLKKSPSSENATPQNSSQKEEDLNSEYGEQGKDKRQRLD